MNEEVEIDLRELIYIILKRKIMIILVTLIFMIVAAVGSLFIVKRVYEGKATIVISKKWTDAVYENTYTNSDIMMYQKLVKTYVEISTSRRVLSFVADQYPKYDYEALKTMVKGTAKVDTQLFTITVRSENQKDAADIANNVAEYFIVLANEYLDAAGLKILDKATIPKSPVSPNVKLNIIIAMFLGVMVSLGITFLLEYIDPKVRNEEELKNIVDAPVLAVIPYISDK